MIPVNNNLNFTDVFPSVEEFLDDYHNGQPFGAPISDEAASQTYYLIYARYGGTNIASFDPFQFKVNLFSIIFEHGPVWVKKRAIQASLRELTEDEILKGSTSIINHALHPQSLPTTQTTEELQFINQQDVSKRKRSKIDAYAMYYELIQHDPTDEYIKRFADLFTTFVGVQPTPVWFTGDER